MCFITSHLVIGLEQPLLLFLINPTACVLHFYYQVGTVCTGSQGNLPFGTSEFEGVIEEVEDNLSQAVFIGLDLRQGGRQLQI